MFAASRCSGSVTVSLTGMIAVASAEDQAGTVLLQAASRTTGRYVLVWFSRLPSDSAGTFQVDVYDVTVDGTGPAR
jgi:hypothetical protein